MEPSTQAVGLIIRTSSQDWMASLAAAYKANMSVTLVDDANLGLDPMNQTLLDMGRKAHLSRREWTAVLIGLGMSSIGAFLILMAILDPEPYSKITFALGAGAAMTMGGGFAAMRVITGHKPPIVRLSPTGGFEIRFE
jgi:hypothetical protein